MTVNEKITKTYRFFILLIALSIVVWIFQIHKQVVFLKKDSDFISPAVFNVCQSIIDANWVYNEEIVRSNGSALSIEGYAFVSKSGIRLLFGIMIQTPDDFFLCRESSLLGWYFPLDFFERNAFSIQLDLIDVVCIEENMTGIAKAGSFFEFVSVREHDGERQLVIGNARNALRFRERSSSDIKDRGQ